LGEIVYKILSEYKAADLLRLYDNVGWKAYTKDPEKLINAVQNSLYVLTAWDQDKLIGLIRIIGDGEFIIYIQDLLVAKGYQHRGIGSTLLRKVLEKYAAVRQKVLLTDDTEIINTFYKANGFNRAEELDLVSYVSLKED